MSNIEIAIGIVTGLFYVVWVWLPAARLMRHWVPDPKEWQRVREEIGGLNRDVVDDAPYHSNTKQALKLVLSSDTGYGRLNYVPMALDVVQGTSDYVARTLRALSAQSIVVGLAGTVATFSVLFWSEKLATRTTPEIAQQLAARVLGHLSVIYAINAFAVITAFLLSHLSWRAKQRGDQATLAASEAFGSLLEGGESSLGPELAAALERSAGEFRAFSENLFNDQFAKIERLLGQVKGLGDGIRELVREVVAQNRKEQNVLHAQLRESSTSIERMTQRLDDGFKLLAQPFVQGIPAIEAMTEAAEQMRSAAMAVTESKLAESAQELRGVIDRVGRAVEELPARVALGVELATQKFDSAATAAIAESLRTVIQPIADTTLADGVERLRELTEVGRQVSERMNSAVADIQNAQQVAANRVVDQLEASQLILKSTGDSLSASFDSSLQKQIGTATVDVTHRLSKAFEDLQKRVEELRSAVERQHPEHGPSHARTGFWPFNRAEEK